MATTDKLQAEDILGLGTEDTNVVTPSINAEQIRQHWGLLNHTAHGCTEIVVIDRSGRLFIGFFDDPDALLTALQPHVGKHVYVGNNPRPSEWADNRFASRRRASDRDIEVVCAIPLDIDPIKRKKGEIGSEEEHQAALENAGQIAAHYGGAVVDSGGGAYVWLSIVPTSVSELGGAVQFKNQVSLWRKRLAQRYDLSARGLQIDATQDLVHIYRLAGTHNHKGNGRPCRIISLPSELAHKALEEILAIEVGEVVSVEEFDFSTDELPQRFQKLLAGDGKLNELFEEPASDGDQSARDFALACCCLETGLTKEETAAVLFQAPHGKRRRDNRKADYVQATVAGAVRVVNDHADEEKDEAKVVGQHRVGTQSAEVADPAKLAELLPASGLLREYSDWARLTTSAPAHFHLFSGLLCIAGVLERRVRIEYGPINIYPNLYLALVAPSSFYYKTSAQTPAKRLLAKHQTFAKNGEERSLILPREFSPEALYDILSEQPSGVFLWNEMGQQLKRFQRDYMAGTVEFLTEAYDSPEEPIERRLRGGHWRIEKPCFSIFAGTTIHWLERNLTEEMALGGFLPRWPVVPATIPEAFRPLPPTLDDSVEAKLSSTLAELRNTYKAPQGDMAPQSVGLGLVKARYERWACDLYGRISDHRAEELLAAWGVRLMPLALKLGMLFEMGTTGEAEISLDSWERGRAVADFLYVYLRQFVEEEMAFTPFQRDRRKVCQLVDGAGAGGISRADISLRTKIKKRDLDEIMEALVKDEGTVVERRGPRPERGPTATVYYTAQNAP